MSILTKNWEEKTTTEHSNPTMIAHYLVYLCVFANGVFEYFIRPTSSFTVFHLKTYKNKL